METLVDNRFRDSGDPVGAGGHVRGPASDPGWSEPLGQPARVVRTVDPSGCGQLSTRGWTVSIRRGVLRPLFGPGIREIAVAGNLPERLRPGAAHNRYFARHDHDADGDVAFHLRAVLALADGAALQASIAAPPPDPSTVSRTVHRSWQRSM